MMFLTQLALVVLVILILCPMSTSLMSPRSTRRTKGLLSSSFINHTMLVLMFLMTVLATWAPQDTLADWQPQLQMSCALLILILLIGRPYGPTPTAPAILLTLLLPLLLITPWPLLILLIPLPPCPPLTLMRQLLRRLTRSPLTQLRMDPILPILLLWKTSSHYALALGSPCAGLSLSVLDRSILQHFQNRLLGSLSCITQHLPMLAEDQSRFAFRVGTLCLLLRFLSRLREFYWERAQWQGRQIITAARKILLVMIPPCIYIFFTETHNLLS